MIGTKKPQARILALTIAMAAFGCGDCFSDGSDGEFFADQDVELPGGEYDFTSFTIEEGVTVTVTGSEPLIIRTADGATINGVLAADGSNGTNGIGGGQSNINPVGGFGRIRTDKDTQTDTGTILPRSPFEGGPWYVPVDAP